MGGQVSRVAEYLRARPLALLAIGVVAGTVLSANLVVSRPVWTWATLIATGATLSIAGLLRRGVPAAALLVGLSAGFARHEWAERVPAGDISRVSLPALTW